VLAVKSVSLRIEEEMLKKIGHVAEYEGRSVNSHVLMLIRKDIEQYEIGHGKIDSPIDPALNVKPQRK